MANKNQTQARVYLEDKVLIHKLQGVRANGKKENEADVIRRLLIKMDTQAEKNLTAKMDAKRLFGGRTYV